MKKNLFILALCVVVPAQGMSQLRKAQKLFSVLHMQQRTYVQKLGLTIGNRESKDLVEIPQDCRDKLLAQFFSMRISLDDLKSLVNNIEDPIYPISDDLYPTEFFKAYISFIPDINKQDKYGWTLLMYAANKGKFEVVDLLLQHKDIRVNSYNSFIGSPLHLAVYKRHMLIVEKLLDRPETIIGFSTLQVLSELDELGKVSAKIHTQLRERGWTIKWGRVFPYYRE